MGRYYGVPNKGSPRRTRSSARVESATSLSTLRRCLRSSDTTPLEDALPSICKPVKIVKIVEEDGKEVSENKKAPKNAKKVPPATSLQQLRRSSRLLSAVSFSVLAEATVPPSQSQSSLQIQKKHENDAKKRPKGDSKKPHKKKPEPPMLSVVDEVESEGETSSKSSASKNRPAKKKIMSDSQSNHSIEPPKDKTPVQAIALKVSPSQYSQSSSQRPPSSFSVPLFTSTPNDHQVESLIEKNPEELEATPRPQSTQEEKGDPEPAPGKGFNIAELLNPEFKPVVGPVPPSDSNHQGQVVRSENLTQRQVRGLVHLEYPGEFFQGTGFIRIGPYMAKTRSLNESNTVSFVVMAGDIQVVMDDEKVFWASGGDSFFVLPGQSYSFISESDSTSLIFYITKQNSTDSSRSMSSIS